MRKVNKCNLSKTFEDDQKVVYRVLGVPFGGPEKKDLHGEYFSKDTYFGDDIHPEPLPVAAMYNHHTHEFLGGSGDPKDTLIVGSAKYLETTDEGRWYELELLKQSRYFNLIEQLNAAKALGLSSQCFGGVKMTDDTTGHIQRWIVNEISFTPTPAEPATIGQVEAIYKSLGIDLPEAPVEEKSEEAPVSPVQEEPEETLESEIEAMFSADEEEETLPMTAEDIAKRLDSIESSVKAWGEVLIRIDGWLGSFGAAEDEEVTMADILSNIAQGIASVKASQATHTSALKTFAENVAKSLRGDVVKMAAKSRTEVSIISEDDSEPEVKPQAFVAKATRLGKSPVPDHAPGG